MNQIELYYYIDHHRFYIDITDFNESYEYEAEIFHEIQYNDKTLRREISDACWEEYYDNFNETIKDKIAETINDMREEVKMDMYERNLL